jgi:hypothetical protein
MRTSLKLSLALAAALGITSTAQAQTSQVINATATVLSAITITGTDLAFGNIAPTQTKTIAPAAGGTFVVTGSANSAVTVSLTTLPTNINSAALALGSWTGLHGQSNLPASGAAFVPSTSFSTAATLSATGLYHMWIGATLTATAATPGSYTSATPITIQVVYN